jgi:hypothetical protein
MMREISMFGELFLDGVVEDKERGAFAIICSHGIDGNIADVYGASSEEAREAAKYIIRTLNKLEEVEAACRVAEEALRGAVLSHSRGCQIYLKRDCDCWLADRKEALARLAKLRHGHIS